MTAKLGKPRLGGAVYILPNLITTGNLFFGFFSIVKGLQGDLMGAAVAILLAAVFDVFDGRVARLTGGTSEFGVQYDSLCDLVSFGVAPAFLMYHGGLASTGRLGWIICFMFLACGALRLARFNVASAIGKASGDFIGLPIPMAAAVIACFVAALVQLKTESFSSETLNIIRDWFISDLFVRIFFFAAGSSLAIMMVSNIGYRSHKTIKIKGIKPFKLLVFFVIIVGLVAFQPEIFGFLFFLGYALSGPVEWLFAGRKLIEDDDIFAEEDEESGEKNIPSP